MANDVTTISNNAEPAPVSTQIGAGDKISISFVGFNAEASGLVPVIVLAVMFVAVLVIGRRLPHRG